MVFKRKFDCLSVGFDFPNIPRAPRSCRRKVLSKKIDDDYDTKICAIDLLALAGKLLQEKESESSSASSNAFEGNNHDVKQEQDDKRKPVKSEFSDQGNSVSRPITTYDNSTDKCVVNSFSFPDNDGVLERTPMSDYKMIHGSMDLGCGTKNANCDSYVKSGGITGETGGVNNVNTGFIKQGEATDPLGDGGLIPETCNLEEATALGVQFPKLVRVGGDLKLPSSMDMTPNGSFARHGNHTNLVRKDDDDKFFSYHKLSNKFKSYRSPSIRRIRKSLSSKYWKQVSKDFGHSRADVGVKTLYRKRKSYCGYNPWQRDIIYKRRRSPDRSSVVTSDGGLSSGSVSKLSKKGDTVKLSIKSFRIPELFIEVPDTASVGSLKRTVMEAVGVLLSGGIRVGVLMHGKKVRDDRKTLSQTGISCDENLDNLGFTLEPGPGKVPLPLCSEDPAVPTDLTNLSERSAASPTLDSGVPHADDVINSGNIVESNLDLVPYQSDISVDEPSSDSKALVPLPSLEVKALAIVPLNQKPKRSELAQRRTRRPFSVTEVEALVQAVEELGTGRWRDVKLRAFENSEHRTYVDLKDKWKTLVHTASISPQQRRGEPVPQDLLDRVLRAYGYWSQHQGKHQARGASKDPDMNRGRALESGVSVYKKEVRIGGWVYRSKQQ